MTKERFLKWLSDAPAGEQLVYHRGFLAPDVARERFLFDQPDRVLDFLHRAVQEAVSAGFCAVTQRRVSRNRFEYIATKTETADA